MASYREGSSTERFEKRKNFRFPVQLLVQLGHKTDDFSSICTNLSWQGASIETSDPLGISERLAITVTIAPKEEPLRMLGQVIWKRNIGALDAVSQPISEVGVRFLRPLPMPWKFQGEPEVDFETPMDDLPEVFPFEG